MKPALTLLLLLGAAVAQTPAVKADTSPASSAAVPADTNARQAREIIDKSIKALGGDAYLSYADIMQHGRSHGFYQGTPRGVGVPYWRSMKFPDKEKVEFFREKDWVIYHVGDEGWETTYHGTRVEEDKDTQVWMRRRDHSLENVLRHWLKDPGSMLFYDGLALANTRQTHKVTVMNLRNQSVTLFIDTNTFLPVQKTFTYRDQELRERVEEGEIYDQYREVQGIQTPHNITRTQNGLIASQRFLYEVKYNNGFSDGYFTAPPVNFDPKKRRLPIEGPPK